MCGIVGQINYGGPADEAMVHRMCTAVEHRGPDSRGIFVDGGVAMATQRLAIIDVAGGDQPVFNEDGSVVAVLNGEIYNFQELRRELMGKGHRFASGVDTEVLPHLYEEHGAGMVERLRGMFAFAVWDARRRQLLLARDRAGKKPLFWARKGSRLWFSSEIRPLLEDPDVERDIEPRAIGTYLALQYVPYPLSAFRAIHKMPPASRLTVTAHGEKLDSYWSLDYSRKLTGLSVPELEECVRAQIWEATRVRLLSDVPLGAFLSGGVDSSAVVAAMADQMSEPVKTFSIGYPHREHDERPYARLVAERFGTDHHEFVVEPDALSMMPKMARHYGEPFGDPSCIPSFHLARLTRSHVSVALNGDGGDESFAGYDRYNESLAARGVTGLPRPVQQLALRMAERLAGGGSPSTIRRHAHRLGRILAMTPVQRYGRLLASFDAESRQRLLSPEFAARIGDLIPEDALAGPWHASTAPSRVERLMDVDVQTYLAGDLNVKIDIATMASSLEARSPFLDHQLMEFAASVPAELKHAGTHGKLILRKAMRGVLPDAVLDRPKMGFGVPLGQWFRNELRELPAQVLLDSRSLARGYFQRSELERLIHQHRAGLRDNATSLWVLMQLEMWHREVVDAPAGRIAPESGGTVRSTRCDPRSLTSTGSELGRSAG